MLPKLSGVMAMHNGDDLMQSGFVRGLKTCSCCRVSPDKPLALVFSALAAAEPPVTSADQAAVAKTQPPLVSLHSDMCFTDFL